MENKRHNSPRQKDKSQAHRKASSSPAVSRWIEVSKEVGRGLGIDMMERGPHTVITKVQASSPLLGSAWPGDIIESCSAPGSAQPTRQLRGPDYVEIFRDASSLSICVSTPEPLQHAVNVALYRPDRDTRIGITYCKDAKSGLVRLEDVGKSLASQLTGSDRMYLGDFILAVTLNGTVHEVTNMEGLQAMLKSAEAVGDIGFRLGRSKVASDDSENQRP